MISKYNPGNLKYSVSFYSNTVTRDAQGFKVSSLSKVLTTKCGVIDSYFEDSKRSGSDNYDTTRNSITIVVRYSDKINEKCLVEIFGTKYRIKKYQVFDMKRYLKLVLQNV